MSKAGVKTLLELLNTLPRKKVQDGVRSEDLLREVRDTPSQEILDNSLIILDMKNTPDTQSSEN